VAIGHDRRMRRTPISRRAFLAAGAAVVGGACTSGRAAPSSTAGRPPPSATGPASSTTTSITSTTAATTPSTAVATPTTTAVAAMAPPLPADPFTLGVGSGDPDERSAVIWTRLRTPDDPLPEEVEVVWEVAADESFRRVSATGTAPATAADAHSVHAVVDLDAPSWYRFRAGGWTSPAGRVAPAPAVGDSGVELRMATANCQNFATGFYAAHRDIAEWRPDLVVFLGDFIYEDPARPPGPGLVRAHEGPEPTDLEGYRGRYAQYLGDPQLQASRAACPWLVIWDDHEVENNYAGTVPENPAAGFGARRAAAYRAWWEHMPVRLAPPQDERPFPVHRRVAWGGLADLILLDGRQYRSDQACNDVVLDTGPPCPEAADPTRTMLGQDQEQWLGDAFAAPNATWTVLGQQTLVTDLRLPNGGILNYDQWDGYAPARDRLLAQAAAAERVVVLTGDIHVSVVGTIPGVGIEFVTTSISSESPLGTAVDATTMTGLFPNVVDAELVHRGYTRHTVRADTWTAEYRMVDDVRSPDSPVSTWRTFRVDADSRDTVARG
jgi:alkaline phosphatase D